MTISGIPAKKSPSLQAGSELELGFNDLLTNGQAVGRTGGMVVFCFGPLPGERARVRIASVKPKYAVADLIELTLLSPERAQPFCPVFGTCGGCQVQHLTYEAQLRWKRDVVKNALQRIGGFEQIDVCDPIGMSFPRAYRNKMSLVVSSSLGFYKQRSHDVVAIDGCPIVMPALDEHVGILAKTFREGRTKALFAQTRHIVERTAKETNQSVITFTTGESSRALADSAQELMARLPGTVGITNSFSLSSENAIMGRKHRLLAGSEKIEEQIGGARYRVSPGSFFQVNVEIVGRLFDFMRPKLDVARKIVDLYCGAGTFSIFFAMLGSDVVGIEENKAAIAEARENAKLNGLSGSVRFYSARVEEAVRGGKTRDALAESQIVFLDPPRKGSDEGTLAALAASGVADVWYLSCDPATLARDLKFLSAKGYRLGQVQPFDMFPQTGHVETLAMMYRKSA